MIFIDGFNKASNSKKYFFINLELLRITFYDRLRLEISCLKTPNDILELLNSVPCLFHTNHR